MSRRSIDKATHKSLVERFGEPLVGSQSLVETCCQCGMMQVDEEAGCPNGHMDEDMNAVEAPAQAFEESDELDQVTPPGGERVVKALKKQKGVRNPWAVAWALHNKK